MNHQLFEDRIETPLGELAVLSDEEERLCSVHWTEFHDRPRRHGAVEIAVQRRAEPSGPARALAAYFEGDVTAIDDLPTTANGTPFQLEVWAALRAIGCGEVVSYGEIARRIGRPAAVRAVGLANHANPIAIVVPCHRVIGKTGALVGYGGGIQRKQWLLAHETKCITSRPSAPFPRRSSPDTTPSR